MPKKVHDPKTLALEALALALVDPVPKVLFGTPLVPGFFRGSSQLVKAAAKLCRDWGWLESTGEIVGRGARGQEKHRLTAAGIHAVLENSEALHLLRGLSGGLQTQVEVLKTVLRQIGQFVEKVGPFADAIGVLQRRLEPVNLEEVRRRLDEALTAFGAARGQPDTDWLERVPELATKQRQREQFQLLSMPVLLKQLRREWPALTLGQFHDGLRALHEAGRIQLVPYTADLWHIRDRCNALFLDGKVMYYVDVKNLQ